MEKLISKILDTSSVPFIDSLKYLTIDERMQLFRKLCFRNDVIGIRNMFRRYNNEIIEYASENDYELFNSLIIDGCIASTEWFKDNIKETKVQDKTIQTLVNNNAHSLLFHLITNFDIGMIKINISVPPEKSKIFEYLCKQGYTINESIVDYAVNHQKLSMASEIVKEINNKKIKETTEKK